MTKLLKWLDAASFPKLVLTYCLVSAVVIVLGILIFFPILLIYSALGMEFSFGSDSHICLGRPV
jgi:hypothetical protein